MEGLRDPVLKDGTVIEIHHFEDFPESVPAYQVFVISASLDGEEIASGRFDVVSGHFRGIEVSEPYRRLGVASAIYDYVEQVMGFTVTPSGHLEPDGQSFWNNRNKY